MTEPLTALHIQAHRGEELDLGRPAHLSKFGVDVIFNAASSVIGLAIVRLRCSRVAIEEFGVFGEEVSKLADALALLALVAGRPNATVPGLDVARVDCIILILSCDSPLFLLLRVAISRRLLESDKSWWYLLPFGPVATVEVVGLPLLPGTHACC